MGGVSEPGPVLSPPRQTPQSPNTSAGKLLGSPPAGAAAGNPAPPPLTLASGRLGARDAVLGNAPAPRRPRPAPPRAPPPPCGG